VAKLYPYRCCPSKQSSPKATPYQQQLNNHLVSDKEHKAQIFCIIKDCLIHVRLLTNNSSLFHLQFLFKFPFCWLRARSLPAKVQFHSFFQSRAFPLWKCAFPTWPHGGFELSPKPVTSTGKLNLHFSIIPSLLCPPINNTRTSIDWGSVVHENVENDGEMCAEVRFYFR